MLKMHHVGCLVESIDEAAETYRKLLHTTNVSEKIFVSSQGVYVCFIELTDKSYIELIESVDEDSVVSKLRRKGFTYYHIGYTVKDFDQALTNLDAMNFKLINVFHSEAFEGKRCSFLYSPEMHLVEVIEE